MEQSPFWESTSSSVSQEIPCILLNPMVTFKRACQIRGLCELSVIWRVLTASSYYLATPQTGEPPLVGCSWLHIQHILSYSSPYRPFLHLERQDAPCCGDKDPLITNQKYESLLMADYVSCFVHVCYQLQLWHDVVRTLQDTGWWEERNICMCYECMFSRFDQN